MMMAGKCECRASACLAAGLIALLASSCAEKGVRREDAGDLSGQVHILRPFDLPVYTQAVEQVLARAFPSATTFPMQKWDQAFQQAAQQGAVLVIPAADRLPSDLWSPLQNYLQSGGRALFLGLAPFEQRVWSSPGGLRTAQELAWDFSAAAVPVSGLAPVQEWRLRKEGDGLPDGSLRAVSPSAEMPWAGVQVEVNDFNDWTGVVLEEANAKVAASANAFVFFARGGAGTDVLVLECTEQDGAHWVQNVPLRSQWTPVVLRVEGFRHVHGGRDRGGPGDQLNLRRLRRISAGLSMHIQPLLPGSHQFALSDLRLYRDPRPVEQAVAWPDLPLLSPPFRRQQSKAIAVQVAGSAAGFRFAQEQPFAGPLPLAGGMSVGAPHRWITMPKPAGSMAGRAARRPRSTSSPVRTAYSGGGAGSAWRPARRRRRRWRRCCGKPPRACWTTTTSSTPACRVRAWTAKSRCRCPFSRLARGRRRAVTWKLNSGR